MSLKPVPVRLLLLELLPWFNRHLRPEGPYRLVVDIVYPDLHNDQFADLYKAVRPGRPALSAGGGGCQLLRAQFAGDVPMPPDVQAGRVITTEVNQPVTFMGSFTDLNPGDTHTVVWSFGDGVTVTGTLTPTHTYRSAGVYTATLTITDSSGFMVSDTVPVYVTMNPYPYPYPAP